MNNVIVLETIADALEAASRVIRNRLSFEAESREIVPKKPATSAVAKALETHPRLGQRQIEILQHLESAGDAGMSSGQLASEMSYEQPNVYNTLQSLLRLHFVEERRDCSPHIFRLRVNLRGVK